VTCVTGTADLSIAPHERLPTPPHREDWSGLKRGVRARPLEWIAERLIFLISLSAILTTLLIFIFVTRESLPVLFGRMDSSHKTLVIPVAEMDKHSDKELSAYLEMTVADFKAMDAETRKLMMEVKAEAAKDADGQGRRCQLGELALPATAAPMDRLRQAQLYLAAGFGDSQIQHRATAGGQPRNHACGHAFCRAAGPGCGDFVSQLASNSVREWIREPAIELLSGIPSVVMGFFALLVMASVHAEYLWLRLRV